MNFLAKTVFVGTLTLPAFLAGCGPSAPETDLQAVLDITADTLYSYQDSNATRTDLDPDAALVELADALGRNYNAAEPALHSSAVAVAAQQDASLLAVEDSNNNMQADEGEDALWMIEIDGEKARIIATSKSGAVSDHGFSGTSLLAGFLIGSMLSRQRAAGVNPKALAGKQPVSAKQAARARAGSGSHAKGK